MAIARNAASGGYDPINRSLIPPHLLSATSPVRNSGTFTWGTQFWVTFPGNAYGARIYYIQGGSPETATVSLWRVSDSALLAQGSTSLDTTGVQDINFASPVALETGIRHRLGIYIPGAYITIATVYSGISAPTTNYLDVTGIYYETPNLFVTAANTMPTTSGAARTPIGLLIN